MLIDWITARLSLAHFGPEQLEVMRHMTDRIMRYDPKTGAIHYETAAHTSIRSDSHQVTIKITASDFRVMGSPARCIADGCNVFGFGACRDLDIRGALGHMLNHVFSVFPEIRPSVTVTEWQVVVLDITDNLLLQSLPEVRSALSILRGVEGGRYRVSSVAGDSVYWGGCSKLRKGKAYAKGPQLVAQQKNKDYTGRVYTPDEIELANKILRLELRLGREYFRRVSWLELTPEKLKEEHSSYFSRMVGGCEVTTDKELYDRVLAVAPTEGKGKAAFSFWCLVCSEGLLRAKEFTSKTTFYRHLEILHAAGIGDADLSHGKLVHFRKRIIEARSVSSWSEMRAA